MLVFFHIAQWRFTHLTINERSFYYLTMNTADPNSYVVKPVASRVSKGEETRAAILKAALRQASVHGFEGLTIGGLAEQTGMSKSGLFAHFGSKEELQIATLDEALRRFNETATLPALSAPRGLKRMEAMCEGWLTWTSKNDLAGCPLMTAMAEFDDKPGPVRDAVLEHMKRLHDGLVRAVQMAMESGEFRIDTDPEQLAFEIFGIVSSCYRSRNLFRDPNANQRARTAFQRLVSSVRAEPAAPSPDVAPHA